MGRLAFFIALVLATASWSPSAQPIDRDAPRPWDPAGPVEVELEAQKPPVYLKNLTSAGAKEVEGGEDVKNHLLVEETINRIGRSFETGDAAELENCLVTGKRKIYLALEFGDKKPGHYGPGQVRHIFGRFFREVESRYFRYDPREIERQNGSAVFRADWSYVVIDADEEVTERLQFTLEMDKGDWRIFEIRAGSR